MAKAVAPHVKQATKSPTMVQMNALMLRSTSGPMCIALSMTTNVATAISSKTTKAVLAVLRIATISNHSRTIVPARYNNHTRKTGKVKEV